MLTELVLMKHRADTEDMELVIVISVFLLAPLALLFGVDSRLDERRWGDWRRS
jgi:hypothetical protein